MHRRTQPKDLWCMHALVHSMEATAGHHPVQEASTGFRVRAERIISTSKYVSKAWCAAQDDPQALRANITTMKRHTLLLERPWTKACMHQRYEECSSNCRIWQSAPCNGFRP